jgi:predicted ATP-dependent endonuclease of OLD family
MKLRKAIIKNYKSIPVRGVELDFLSNILILVGPNNSGKSNILQALQLILGDSNPTYSAKPNYFNDLLSPIEIQVIFVLESSDGNLLYSAPGITKICQKAVYKKLKNDEEVEVAMDLTLWSEEAKATSDEAVEQDEDTDSESASESIAPRKNSLKIKIGSFDIHSKLNELRKVLVRCVLVPVLRDAGKELGASAWTPYGVLMKSVLEGHSRYPEVCKQLDALNSLIQNIFDSQKNKLVV